MKNIGFAGFVDDGEKSALLNAVRTQTSENLAIKQQLPGYTERTGFKIIELTVGGRQAAAAANPAASILGVDTVSNLQQKGLEVKGMQQKGDALILELVLGGRKPE